MRTTGLYDVIVVGGGIIGCSSAYALAVKGVRTLLIEGSAIGNAAASSHGRSRIIRLAYDSDEYIKLARAAFQVWKDVEADVEMDLMRKVGGLDLAFESVGSWQKSLDAMQKSGVSCEVLSRQELERAWPQFDVPEGTVSFYQPDTAILHADLCLEAMVKLARRSGVDIVEWQEVKGITPTPNGVTIATDSEVYRAQNAVLAAGPQMPKLLKKLDLELRLAVSKEHVAFFQPARPQLFGPDRLPVFIMHFGNGRLGSGFPLVRDAGVKVMIESRTPSTTDDLSLDFEHLWALQSRIKQILPDLAVMSRAETCRYTMTPDSNFVIDRHPCHRQILIASPCSGHGFKFGPLLGSAVAEMCVGDTLDGGLQPFRIDRPLLGYRQAVGDVA
ncbi:MAG: N-methyl-L-tryptophan oxidase [Phyllobacterium sp.]|uniref:N-methyl-L-tryptophan oxidase n=1 Tax=Phyllobacterium sp. TaxID=1871046 RepID=UPI0030F1543E